MCVVIDLDVVCLVCLQLSSCMHEIYKCVDDEEIQIAQKITTLSKLKVDTNNESLPDKICDDCLNDLKAAWRFHKNCQTAVAVFQSILKPLVSKKVQPQPALQTDEKIHELTKKQQVEDEEKHDQQSPLSINKDNPTTIDDEQAVASRTTLIPAVGAVQEVAENVIEKDPTDEFLELDRVEVQEDYQTIETPEDDLELVEYYLSADDALHEHQEETVGNTVETTTIKKENESTKTIASKKIIMSNTAEHLEKVWPAVLTKSAAATSTKASTSRSKGRQTSYIQPLSKPTVKPTNPEHRKSPKPVKRPTRFVYPQQIATKVVPQQQFTENEEEYETLVRPVKSSRKRKQSPDAKPPKICEICGNSYRFQHALNAHMRRHFQDKPFPCEMCDKAFVSNVELRRHMRVHTGQKPYACSFCDRRFSDFGSRIKHERTHTGERPYKCNTCDKSFAYPHVLSVHLRTHTGEKRFRCDFCSKGFTKKAYLLTHCEQHHPGRDSKDVTTYELTMQDAGGDTIEEVDDDFSGIKEVKFDDCIFTTEFVGEEHHVEDEEDMDSQDGQENHTIILQESLLRPKPEPVFDEDDADVQEVVEVHLDEYTIRVR